MRRVAVHCLLTVIFIPLGWIPSPLQADDSLAETFGQLKKLSDDADWEKLQSLITAEAFDELVKAEIAAGMGYLTNGHPADKGNGDLKKEIQELYKKYGLDDLKFPEYQPDIDRKVLEKQLQEFRDKAYAKVKPKAMEFLDNLTAVINETALPIGALIMFRHGELDEVKIDNDNATAVITVSPSKLSDDPSVINIYPPVPAKFQKVNGKWRYSGYDPEKRKIMAKEYMDLYRSQFQFDSDKDKSSDSENDKAASNDVQLHARWIPFDKESTYNFAEKWPEINEMKPVKDVAGYSNEFFQSLVPAEDVAIGDIWSVDEKKLLPLIKQFHNGGSVHMHHGGPTGVHASLVGKKDNLISIFFRLHAELRHEDGWYYTPSQFEGQLVWDTEQKSARFFRLRVPPIRTNVDVNRTASSPNEKFKGLNGVDIGFTPLMELKTAEGKNLWNVETDIDVVKKNISKKFYRFAEIDWMPWEEAVAESLRTGKPLHVVALFGTLHDESC